MRNLRSNKPIRIGAGSIVRVTNTEYSHRHMYGQVVRILPNCNAQVLVWFGCECDHVTKKLVKTCILTRDGNTMLAPPWESQDTSRVFKFNMKDLSFVQKWPRRVIKDRQRKFLCYARSRIREAFRLRRSGG